MPVIMGFMELGYGCCWIFVAEQLVVEISDCHAFSSSNYLQGLTRGISLPEVTSSGVVFQPDITSGWLASPV